MTIHVLLIEDANLDHAESLLANLESEGYEVSTSHSPEAALEKTKSIWPNLIVFNTTNTSSNLASFQNALEQTNLKIPCVLIGDKHRLNATINTDTIIVAPGKPQQLNQGMKKATTHQKSRFVRLPGLVLDAHQHQLLRDGQIFSLTPKELKLLQLLIDYHDQILSRKIIMNQVWETDYLGDTRTLDVHIRWLREKIEKNPSRPTRLMTIRGVGYRFIMNPE